MIQKDCLDMEKKAFERRMNIRIKKNQDYAKDSNADFLSNFKEMAVLGGILKIDTNTSYGTAFWHALHKIVRICNLMFVKKEILNESLEDSFDDLENYLDIAKELYMEEGKCQK